MSAKFDSSLIGHATETAVLEYDWRDAALYALGIGAKADELDYLFEGRGPRVFHLFPLAAALDPVIRLIERCGSTAGPRLHSAQTMRIVGDPPPRGRIEIEARLTAIFDHQKFATAVVDTVAKDAASGKSVVEGSWTFLFREAGGYGGPPPPATDKAAPPSTTADYSHREKSTEEQALLYRLSGDLNPLHADPEIARSRGLAQGPILQGLCTFGFMMRAVMRTQPTRPLRSIGGQFRKPALPGDTFVTDVWNAGDGTSIVSLRADGRGETLIGGATATFG